MKQKTLQLVFQAGLRVQGFIRMGYGFDLGVLIPSGVLHSWIAPAMVLISKLIEIK